jgi:hypothetical protein
MDAFKQLGEKGSKSMMGSGGNMAMPTSIGGAAGAIKLDAATQEAATEAQ